ncbi:btb (poz) domain-containing 2a-related [Anaeramoeba flamelloides]|uniref:Btb (Poz) domain-containing 2a-related n=1 Tax=Anaeramoeba flamelloides TaxID=1746091 RepID=A0ABQ8ZC02_9EUKA|nr:btb (poz) domain-containing 2a-related [Anaeramoeba flamelloides]
MKPLPFSSKKYTTPIQTYFGKYINNSTFSDVTFYVGEEKKAYHAHQSVLIMASPFFQSNFSKTIGTDKTSHVDITLKDIKPSNFEQILSFCYTGVISLCEDNCQELYSISKLLDLKKLCNHCVTYIKSRESTQQQKRAKNLSIYCNPLPRDEYSVAILSTGSNLQSHEDLCKLIMVNRFIRKVTTFQIENQIRVLDFKTLKPYNALFLFNNTQNLESSKLVGDLLAQYVIDGGVLIISTINCLVKDNESQLFGKISTNEFLPIPKNVLLSQSPVSVYPYTNASNHNGTNTLLNGIETIQKEITPKRILAKRKFKDTTILAKWSDGNVLVAQRTFPQYTGSGAIIVINSDMPARDKLKWSSCLNDPRSKLISNLIKYSLTCF